MLSGVCFVLHGDWPTAKGFWLELFFFFFFLGSQMYPVTNLSETTFGLRYCVRLLFRYSAFVGWVFFVLFVLAS